MSDPTRDGTCGVFDIADGVSHPCEMTDTSHPLAPAAVVLHSGVADFGSWLAAFNSHEDARRAAGILGHHINRAEGDPNEISVFMALSDLNKAKEFAASDELRERMKASGVIGAPQITYMTPVREAIVWDRQLPAIILSHSVADFDRWLEGYDGAADLQRENGIIGQAANRSLDDPSVAIVYHQAESFETLRSFLGNDELKVKMQEAGVTSAPDVHFFTGGWGKRYT
jgi:hypothetical protein